MKIVLNKCYGGFGLSHEAIMLYAKLSKFKLYAFVDDPNKPFSLGKDRSLVPWKPDKEKQEPFLVYYYKKLTKTGKPIEKSYWYHKDIERNDPILVNVVEKLGDKANGRFAKLKIVDVPDEEPYEITEYDGIESASQPINYYG